MSDESKAVVLMPTKPITTQAGADALLRSLKGNVEQLLPSPDDAARAMRVYQAAISRNPKLLSCTAASLRDCFQKSASFDLEPNTPLQLCHIIPYRNGKLSEANNAETYDATFQMGYQGVIELAYRSGRVSSVYAETVYEKDTFRISKGLHPDLIHEIPATGDRGKVIGYYAVVAIKGQDPLFDYWPLDKIYAHATRYSKAYQAHLKKQYSDTPWKEDPGTAGFDGMAKKTMVFQACKTAPKSISDKFYEALMADDDIGLKKQLIDVTPAPTSLSALTERLEAKQAATPEPEYVEQPSCEPESDFPQPPDATQDECSPAPSKLISDVITLKDVLMNEGRMNDAAWNKMRRDVGAANKSIDSMTESQLTQLVERLSAMMPK